MCKEIVPTELVVEVGNELRRRGWMLATAESCTGGRVANMLTSISGASDFFRGGVVAYSREVKEHLLGVSSEAIDECGIVSELVALQMAKGVCERLNTHIGIATTGWASGVSAATPVGEIWIGLCVRSSNVSDSVAKRLKLDGNRSSIIEEASIQLLYFLSDQLVELSESKK